MKHAYSFWDLLKINNEQFLIKSISHTAGHLPQIISCQLPKHTSPAPSIHVHLNSRPETENVQAIKRFKWIHTLILTDIADAEPPLIGAVVSWPAQKKLVASGGDVEGCGEVTTQCRQCLTMNCGSFKRNRRERQFAGGLLHQITPVKK